MMLPARSCSPLVMNRLTPSMCQEPSGCGTARVRPAPTSDPASGSVSTIVAAQHLIRAEHFEQVEVQVPKVAPVVRHRWSPVVTVVWLLQSSYSRVTAATSGIRPDLPARAGRSGRGLGTGVLHEHQRDVVVE